ncbi:MAG: ankyrin repeat domain-containing protein [Gammaproteobacteria bacterium]|nr:ankyrin repeat domain-containing protein [Gammaproteobacteria bacterium]
MKRLQVVVLVMFAVLAVAIAADDTEPEHGDSSAVLESPDKQHRLMVLAPEHGVVIDGVSYTTSGVYRKGPRAEPLYGLHGHSRISAITDDGQYAVLSGAKSVSFVGPGLYREFVAEELYEDISVVPNLLDTDWYPWIKNIKFDDRGRRYYLETLEDRLFIFDMTTGEILGISAAVRPAFSVDVVRDDGTSDRLSHFRKCGSAFSLFEETKSDSNVAVTGFVEEKSGDGQVTGHVVAIPFEEITKVERVGGNQGAPLFDVFRSNGETVRMAIESIYAFCGKSEAEDRVRVAIGDLKALANFQAMQTAPLPETQDPEAMAEYLDFYQRAGDRNDWTPMPKDAYILVDYREFSDAAAKGEHERLKEYLAIGADPGYSGSRLGSPLNAAIQEGQFPEAKYMLRTGKNISFDPKDSILLRVVRKLETHGEDKALVRCIDLLLSKGANPDPDAYENETPLLALLRLDRIDLMEKFLEKGADANRADPRGRTPLYVATTLEAVETLLKHGADSDYVLPSGKTHLYTKIESNADLEIIEAMLRAGGDPNIQPAGVSGNLWWAFSRNDTRLLELLVKYGLNMNPPPNDDGETLLFAAIRKGQADMADALLRHGMDPDHKNRSGQTVLFLAGSPELIELLSRHGADVNAKDQWGKSRLADAVGWDRLELAEALLKAGADANGMNRPFGRLLEFAVTFGKVELARLLVKYGADPNVAESRDETLVHKAATRPTEMLQVLLDAGADPNVVDKMGRTPLERLCVQIPAAGGAPGLNREALLKNFELLSKRLKDPPSVDECRTRGLDSGRSAGFADLGPE